jgi:hypothetical protein
VLNMGRQGRLVIAWGGPVSAPGEPVRRAHSATYRRNAQACQHGRVCGYTYTYEGCRG